VWQYFLQISSVHGNFEEENTDLDISIIIINHCIIIIIEFFTSQLQLGNIHLSCDIIIDRNRLDGLIYSLKSSLQLNMFQKLQIFAFFLYVLGCKLSLFRLCGSNFGITPVDDITNGIA